MDKLMDKLFEEFSSYDLYKNILAETLDADYNATIDTNYLHETKLTIITNDMIKHSNKTCVIKDKIKYLYYVYVDLGENEWDTRYYFFVGRY